MLYLDERWWDLIHYENEPVAVTSPYLPPRAERDAQRAGRWISAKIQNQNRKVLQSAVAAGVYHVDAGERSRAIPRAMTDI